MLKSRSVAVILVLAMLMGLPVSAWAADSAKPEASGPQITTSAAPLSAAELARYGQLQTAAEQNGVLQQKGGGDETTWIIIGCLGAAAVIVGLVIVSQA